MASNIEIRHDRESRPVGGYPATRDVDDMFNRFFGSRLPSLFGDMLRPSLFNELPQIVPSLMRAQANIDVEETDRAYLVRAELPGVPQEDIDITVNGNLLTVRAEESEEKRERGEYRRHYRRFLQSLALPNTVDTNNLEANYENGVLEILIPKTEQAQARRVQVKAGKGGGMDRLTGKESKDKSSSKQDQQKH